MTDRFEHSPIDLVLSDPAQATADVRAYLRQGSDVGFTGSQFETVAGRNVDPYSITADDIIAVSMLGVQVPAPAAIWILGAGASEVTRHLRRIDPEPNLWDRPDLVAPGGGAWALWELLRTIVWEGQPGAMGRTKTSKLLAAKRLRLLPIHDRRVRRELYPEAADTFDFWAAWAIEMGDRPAERELALGHLRQAHGAEGVSDLRLFDIAIWSRSSRKSRLQRKG